MIILQNVNLKEKHTPVQILKQSLPRVTDMSKGQMLNLSGQRITHQLRLDALVLTATTSSLYQYRQTTSLMKSLLNRLIHQKVKRYILHHILMKTV